MELSKDLLEVQVVDLVEILHLRVEMELLAKVIMEELVVLYKLQVQVLVEVVVAPVAKEAMVYHQIMVVMAEVD